MKEMNRRKGQVLIDRVGESQRFYELTQKHNKERITPPKKGAILRREVCYQERNEAIRVI